MSNFWPTFERHFGGWRFRLFCVIVASLLCAGCHLFPPLPNAIQDMGPRYHPSNIYRRGPALPTRVRRVAVLPVVAPESATGYLQDGVERLSPLICPELEKTKRFEIIPVSPDDLRQWTGKTGWFVDEQLPRDFFTRICNATGCDAVLFCQLTRYFPYQPVAVGWKFSLLAIVPAKPGSTNKIDVEPLWAADEVLDSGDSSVCNAARDYYSQHLRNEAPSADATTILSSPVRFGQYTLAALFDTIPGRVVATR